MHGLIAIYITSTGFAFCRIHTKYVYGMYMYVFPQHSMLREILKAILYTKVSIPISTKRQMKALAWPVVMYGCESWTLRKNEETRL